MSYLENLEISNVELETLTINIPEYKWDMFRKLIKKLSKMSDSFGITQPKYDHIEVVKYIVRDRSHTIIGLVDDLPTEISKSRYYDKTIFHNVTLTLPVNIKPIEGWEMIGVIDNKENLLKPVPGKEFPKEIMDNITFGSSTNCDHCNKSIYRNKTVIVRSDDSGEYKEVGGTCIKNYLGIDYTKLLQYIESIYVINNQLNYDSMDDEGGFFGKSDDIASIESVIKYFIWTVKNGGYRSNKSTEKINMEISDPTDFVVSTPNKVIDDVSYVSRSIRTLKFDEIEEWEEEVELYNKRVSKVSNEEYQEVIDFINSDDSNSSFIFNVRNLMMDQHVVVNKLNYITGACSYYFGKKLAEESKRLIEEKNREGSSSSHIGEVGEKYSFNVVVTNVKGFETAYGYSHVYNMEDEKGNVIVKFGTINPRYITNSDEFQEVEKGAKLSFSSSVKDHSDFRGVPQTIIDRISKHNPKLSYNK